MHLDVMVGRKRIRSTKRKFTCFVRFNIRTCSCTKVEEDKPFAMLATLLYADNFLGRCLVGRVGQGTARINQNVKAINLNGEKVDAGD